MIFRLDLAEDLFDLSFFIDQKRHTVIAHVGSAHKLLLAVCSVSVRNPPLGIVKDAEGKTVRLKDLRGQRVVLYFYPKDDTKF